MIRQTGSVILAVVLAAFALPGGTGEPVRDTQERMPGRLYVVLSPSSEPGPSAVTRFDFDAEWRPRQGDTYDTGGLGRSFTSPQGLVAHPGGNLLFVSNNHSDDVSVFRILPDGALERGAGPFPVGGMPVYLAVHPSGDFLYVGDATNGLVRVFHIDDSGELTAMQDVPAGLPAEMEVHPEGELLFAAAFSGIRVYSISESGALAEVAGSPFPVPGNRTLHLELDSAGTRLFALDLDEGIAAYDAGSTGTLDLVKGSPFFVSSFASALELSEDDVFLYASSPFDATLDAFRVLGRGRLAEIQGSPFSGDFVAADVLNPPGSSRLYEIGAETRRISVFEIGPNGRLSVEACSPVEVVDEAGRVPSGATFVRRPALVVVQP